MRQIALVLGLIAGCGRDRFADHIDCGASALADAAGPQRVAFSQAVSGVNTGTTAVTAEVPLFQNAGDLMVLVVNWAGPAISSVHDANGNFFAMALSPTSFGGMTQAIFYAQEIHEAQPGTNTVEVDFASAADAEIGMVEYGGIVLVNPFDVAIANTGTSSLATATAVTTNPNDFIVAAAVANTPTTGIGATWAPRLTLPSGSIVQDQQVGQAETVMAADSFALSTSWIIGLAAFEVAPQ